MPAWSGRFVKQGGRMAEKPGKTVAAYEAEAAAMRAKTARLRALRLAREAEQPATAEAPAPGRKIGAKKRAARQPKGTLADWIKARDEGGHNN
jgi:hypothetical protein